MSAIEHLHCLLREECIHNGSKLADKLFASYMQDSGAPARCAITVSAIEIYKEKATDLLVAKGRPRECEVLTNQGRVIVRHTDKSAVEQREVTSVAQAMHLISGALDSRTTRGTACAAALFSCLWQRSAT